MPALLVVSGLDPLGQAGFLRDLEAAFYCGVAVTGVVSCHTVQTDQQFFAAYPVKHRILRKQLRSILSQKTLQAAKVGMVYAKPLIKTLSIFFTQWPIPFVLDPVIQSSSGGRLITPGGFKILKKALVPKATLVTPNWKEAYALAGQDPPAGIKEKDLEGLAEFLVQRFNTSFLIKTGGTPLAGSDLLSLKGQNAWLRQAPKPINHARGTGCFLSSAIASYLSLGYGLKSAIRQGKRAFSSRF